MTKSIRLSITVVIALFVQHLVTNGEVLDMFDLFGNVGRTLIAATQNGK